MRLASLLGHGARLLRTVVKSMRPSDALASNYFRSKKYLGARERRFISAAVFAAFRTLSLVEWCGVGVVTVMQDRNRQRRHVDKPLHPPSTNHIAALEDTIAMRMAGERDDSYGWELCVLAAVILLGERASIFETNEKLAEAINFKSDDPNDIDKVVAVVASALEEQMNWQEGVGHEWAWRTLERWQAMFERGNMLAKRDQISDADLNFLSNRLAMPVWILRSWKEKFGLGTSSVRWSTVASRAEALLHSAPVGLRVNTLIARRSDALKSLSDDNIPAGEGLLAPTAIILDRRRNLAETHAYTHGLIEVQDEASQMLAYALDPEPHWKILDACAGAGGKTLHIAALQKDKGSIIAADVENKRLRELPRRARRATIRSIETVLLKSRARDKNGFPPQLEAHRDGCDAVLVDVPCSGMGTVRRAPSLKWRLTPSLLKRLAARQLELLHMYARCVKPGGVLIYSTCSLMHTENGAVVERFLMENRNFAAEALEPFFERHNVVVPKLDKDAFSITLSPDLHGTDGFFIARMRRKPA